MTRADRLLSAASLGLIFLVLVGAVITGGTSGINADVDTTSKAMRVTLYSPAGVADAEKSTYRFVSQALATVPGSATAPFLYIQGSASKTVYITRVRYSATAATGIAGDFWVAKFTTISGGTCVAQSTIAKANANDASATGAVSLCSVVPTTATKADGTWSAIRYETVTAAVTVLPQIADLEFGQQLYDKPIVLRNTGEYLGIGISASGTTPAADIMIEWTEE